MALVTSAGMTVASAWEGYFRNKEMWVQKTDTLNLLYALDSDIRYARTCKGESLTAEVTDAFYRRSEEILSEANKAWMGIRTTQLTGEKPKSGPASPGR